MRPVTLLLGLVLAAALAAVGALGAACGATNGGGSCTDVPEAGPDGSTECVPVVNPTSGGGW